MSEIVTMLSTVILTAITGFYVYLTHNMLKEMRDAKKPFVELGLHFGVGSQLSFELRNLGQRPAESIRFSVEQDSDAIRGRNRDEKGISHCPLIAKGLAYLPTNRTFRYDVGSVDRSIFRDDGSSMAIVRISISYRDSEKEIYNHVVQFDLSNYGAVPFNSFRSDGEIVSLAIEGLVDELQKQHTQPRFDALSQLPCPHCRSMVARSATKCKFCHERIVRDVEPVTSEG